MTNGVICLFQLKDLLWTHAHGAFGLLCETVGLAAIIPGDSIDVEADFEWPVGLLNAAQLQPSFDHVTHHTAELFIECTIQHKVKGEVAPH